MNAPHAFEFNKMNDSASDWIVEHFGTAAAKKKLAAKKAPAPAQNTIHTPAPARAGTPEERLKAYLEGKTPRERRTINQRVKYYETGDYGKKPGMVKLSRDEAIKKALKE
jgi:hypothetical protein